MENMSFSESFGKFLEDMQQYNTIPVPTYKGSMTLIGSHSKKNLFTFFNELAKKTNVSFIQKGNINKNYISSFLEHNKTDILILELDQDSISDLEVRKIAMEHNIQIIVSTILSYAVKDRLTNRYDFKGFKEEMDAALIIGITDAGIMVNKNRFGAVGELEETETIELVIN